MRRACGLLLAASLGLGCAPSDDAAGEGRAGDELAGGQDPVTAPPGHDVAAVRGHVEELLADHDRLVGEILADPTVATDRDDPRLRQFADLYEPDSERPGATIERWVALADTGRSIRPYDEAHPSVRTRIDGDVQVTSDDEVTVPICEGRREKVYVDGQVVAGTPVVEHAGDVVAVRVGRRWLLHDRTVRSDRPCGQ